VNAGHCGVSVSRLHSFQPPKRELGIKGGHRKFVVVCCWHQSGWAYSLDSRVSVTFQPFLPGHIYCSFRVVPR